MIFRNIFRKVAHIYIYIFQLFVKWSFTLYILRIESKTTHKLRILGVCWQKLAGTLEILPLSKDRLSKFTLPLRSGKTDCCLASDKILKKTKFKYFTKIYFISRSSVWRKNSIWKQNRGFITLVIKLHNI